MNQVDGAKTVIPLPKPVSDVEHADEQQPIWRQPAWKQTVDDTTLGEED